MEPDSGVLVFGTGAVGGYLGGRLLQSRPEMRLALLGRQGLHAAIAKDGLILREQGGERVTHPHVVTSAVGMDPVDVVLLTVRTYDVEKAMPDLRSVLGNSGLLVALQNGVGTETALADALGRERVFPATLTVSTGMESPGSITRYSRSGGLAVSSMTGQPVPPLIVDLFEATDLPTQVVADYRELRWSKLLLNMLGAATSAILDMDMTSLMAHPQIFRIEQLAFREATRIMRRCHINAINLPGYAVPQARLAMRTLRPLAQATLGARIARARAGRSPGMRADLARDRSEIGAFNGAIAAAGQEAGIHTPVNDALTALVLELLSHRERRERYRGQPDQLVAYLARQGVSV